MQWAAIRTQWEAITDPPHWSCQEFPCHIWGQTKQKQAGPISAQPGKPETFYTTQAQIIVGEDFKTHFQKYKEKPIINVYFGLLRRIRPS